MKDLTVSQMMGMQKALWEKNKDSWSPLTPTYGERSILYMVGEIGEVIDAIKKAGKTEIIENPGVRAHFIEEMTDVAMYFFDAALRFSITPEEFATTYVNKYAKNMGRDWEGDHNRFLMENQQQIE